jgi:glyoxylase-like metal-dependent hydrolase (beta-lactamase superfamily II)
MLTRVAPGVRVHRSELLQNNTIVVEGHAGVLLVDPGLTNSEMECIAHDLRSMGQPVAAGFRHALHGESPTCVASGH